MEVNVLKSYNELHAAVMKLLCSITIGQLDRFTPEQQAALLNLRHIAVDASEDIPAQE